MSESYSSFHFQISPMNPSRPMSCLLSFCSFQSFFSTTTCVAMPAWSQPGFHSTARPLIRCLQKLHAGNYILEITYWTLHAGNYILRITYWKLHIENYILEITY